MDIDSLTDSALKKLWDQGFDALDHLDQLLVIIWGLEADVNNGGFDQYYFNSYGDQAKYTPSVLRLIGANRIAELVELANAAFGSEGPPEDRGARQAHLEEIREVAASVWEPLEQEFWLYPDDISGLLRLHLENSRGAA
jgi:hypothetical protein